MKSNFKNQRLIFDINQHFEPVKPPFWSLFKPVNCLHGQLVCQIMAERGLHGGWGELSEIPLKGGTEKMERKIKILKRKELGQGVGALKRRVWNPLTKYDNLSKLAK